MPIPYPRRDKNAPMDKRKTSLFYCHYILALMVETGKIPSEDADHNGIEDGVLPIS
jgi:hypothetical protein